MKNEQRYTIELLRTINRDTGNKRYYKKVCGIMTRISLKEYDSIYFDADGFANLFTNNNGNITRHYTTTTHYI